MDARRFDRLTRALTEAGSRRGLLGLLATVPVLGGFVALFDDDVDANGRRKRRKKRHKHGKGRDAGKKKQKKCNPRSMAKTCAGKCGPVKNNCKKKVDCGSCACDPPCEVCFTCQGEPGICVQDAPGTSCGDPGQVCQADGSCACEASSCPACMTCGDDGACLGCTGCCDGQTCVGDCGDCRVCDEGQCTGCLDCCDAAGVCQPGETNAACGSRGTCDVCTGQGECQGQQCVCVPDCDGKVCGQDGCGGTCEPGCPPHATCSGDGASCPCEFESCDGACCAADQLCCLDTCVTGECCTNAECSGTTPICDGTNTCVACSDSSECPAGQICVSDGSCHACSVTCTGTPAECGAVLQNAMNGGGTVYVCPGAYRGNFSIGAAVTVIGAGDGETAASNTILDGNGAGRVLGISGTGTVVLRQMRFTGGAGPYGAGVAHEGTTLRMTDCTVIGNTTVDHGGGIHVSNSRTLELTRCTIRDNHADSFLRDGGGIASLGMTTLTDCLVEGNSANNTGGGIRVSSGSTTLAGSTTVRDNAAAAGGGIDLFEGTLEIAESCRVTENTATAGAGNGGGIFNSFGTVTLLGAAPSPIVFDNCHENCGDRVPKCAAGGLCPQ